METAQIALCISFFGYVLYGAAGFGAAMIFHSLWSILEMFKLTSGSVAEATYFLNIMTLVVTLVMSYNNRKLIQWDFTITCCIPWFIMNILGCFLLVGLPNWPLKLFLGVVLLGIFFQQTYKVYYSMTSKDMLREKIREAQEQGEQGGDGAEAEVEMVIISEKWPWLAFAGGFGGILSGLFNMPGPATIIILLFSGIHRERWKANFFCWQIPAQFFVVWFLSVKGKLFDPAMMPYYIGMCIVSMTASKLGDHLAKYLDKTTFILVVIGLSSMGAVSNLKVMVPEDVASKLMVGALFFSLSLLGFLFYMLDKHVNKPFQDYMSGNLGLLDDIRLLEEEARKPSQEDMDNYSARYTDVVA